MDGRTKIALGAAGTVLAGWIAWGLYVSRTTERVPYETVGGGDGFEIRRYPTTVAVETTAPDERTAFRRLFEYIEGANHPGEDVGMTAPVETGGEEVAMTAPVETEDVGDDVHMAFLLPEEYDFDTAPEPTDPDLTLVERPGRTLAVSGFSWWATDGRVRRQTETLLSTLSDTDLQVLDDPFLMRYDDPRTPPFMRTNEVAVEVRRAKSG